MATCLTGVVFEGRILALMTEGHSVRPSEPWVMLAFYLRAATLHRWRSLERSGGGAGCKAAVLGGAGFQPADLGGAGFQPAVLVESITDLAD